MATVGEKIALAQYEKAIQSGFREVADALTLTTTLNSQRAAQESLVEATSRAYVLSQRRYKVGRDSYLAVLDSQRSDYAGTAEAHNCAAGREEQSGSVYKALGGGWLERSP